MENHWVDLHGLDVRLIFHIYEALYPHEDVVNFQEFNEP
jgi:hypothetical protein